jgi:hypothetical protein
MKTALIMTVIEIPRVLSLFRAHDPDIMFFVAGDLKTPPEAKEFCEQLGNCVYLSPEAHKQWKHVEHIGFNSDSLRNCALLAAMRWGADLIVSTDADMIPLESRFWFDVVSPFQNPYNGFKLGAAGYWFSHGNLTIPPARERGIPFDHPVIAQPGYVVGAQIGVVQGIILGVPDTDAANAIVSKTMVLGVTDVLRNGFVTDQQCKCVFNSQLTAFRAELAPAFAQFYFAQKRNTDIMASMLMRRIMREKQWYTYYGPPMCFHARQPRPLFNDLKAEMYGLEKINEYADYLNRAPLPKDISVTESCRILAQGWNGPELEAAMAWYEDCEQVMK